MDLTKFEDIFYEVFLPPSFKTRDAKQNNLLYNFLSALGEAEFQRLLEYIYDAPDYIDANLTPQKFLPWLAAFFDFDLVRWSTLFTWDEDQQRTIVAIIGGIQPQLGTRDAITDFVQRFILDATVHEVYEPWQDILVISDYGEISGNCRIPDSLYWREAVVHIQVSNGGPHVIELLRWIIDAKVKIYTTIMTLSQDSDSFTDLLDSGHVLNIHSSTDVSGTLIISDNGTISNIGCISGMQEYSWGRVCSSYSGTMTEWPMLCDSQWTIEEIMDARLIEGDGIIISDSGEISGSQGISGTYYIEMVEHPLSEEMDYIGGEMYGEQE